MLIIEQYMCVNIIITIIIMILLMILEVDPSIHRDPEAYRWFHRKSPWLWQRQSSSWSCSRGGSLLSHRWGSAKYDYVDGGHGAEDESVENNVRKIMISMD